MGRHHVSEIYNQLIANVQVDTYWLAYSGSPLSIIGI